MLRNLLLASALLAPLPAAAQESPISPGYVMPALPATLSPEAALGRFYTARTTPLWIQGPTLSPAGRLVLDRLRTADAEGYPQGPSLAAQVDAALAAPSGNMMSVDRMLSAGWIGLVQAIKGPIPGVRYFNSVTMPPRELPDRTLFVAGQAPDLSAHVTATLRKSRFYEDLRTALLADAAANGGRIDPRLAANLQRARVLPAGGRYLFVNPAAAKLMLVENGEVRDQIRVVVGKPLTPTYAMASQVHFAILNPYWNVAEDLVRKIVAPHVVAQGLTYLKKANYEVVDRYGEGATVIPASTIDWKAVLDGSVQVKMRQKPGLTNSMGKVKFPFTNDFGIFLHDTANKPQFAQTARANSNGCIRLEDAQKVAGWLFGSTPVPVASGDIPDQSVRLPEPIAVYVAYLTAQPTGRGVEYAKDVYSLDPTATASGALGGSAAGAR
jgi:L,D-transpeptidase YcbB